MVVLVAKMVFAELSRGITLRPQQFRHGGVQIANAFIRARQSDFGHPRAKGALAEHERGAAGSAALLAVVIREHDAFARDAVDVGCVIPHRPVIVRADVPGADVVSPNNHDVRLLLGRCAARRENESQDAHRCDQYSTLHHEVLHW